MQPGFHPVRHAPGGWRRAGALLVPANLLPARLGGQAARPSGEVSADGAGATSAGKGGRLLALGRLVGRDGVGLLGVDTEDAAEAVRGQLAALDHGANRFLRDTREVCVLADGHVVGAHDWS